MNGPPAPDPSLPLDDRLHRLAAGELPPAEADALRRRLAAEPALAARFAAIETLEQALAGEALLATPPHLAARIRDGLAPAPRAAAGARTRSGLGGALRAAAAVLAAFAVWTLATGAWPTPARAAPLPAFGDALAGARDLVPLPPLPAMPPAAAGPLGALASLAAGLLLLVGGLLLARRLLGAGPHGASA